MVTKLIPIVVVLVLDARVDSLAIEVQTALVLIALTTSAVSDYYHFLLVSNQFNSQRNVLRLGSKWFGN